MRWYLSTLWRGLTSNGAEVSPESVLRQLRMRVYAIPFDRVWNTSLDLIEGEVTRWSLISADDYEGIITAEVGESLLSPRTSVRLRIGLSADAQTIVEGSANAPDKKVDLGASPRALGHFLSALDHALLVR